MKGDEGVLAIDELRLDVEWSNQAATYHHYALKLVEAKKDVDEAKATLDLVRAEQDGEVRLHPHNYRIDKMTEKRAEMAVITTEPYKRALRDYNQARYAAGVLQAMVDALDHKKKALENLVHLRLSDFYAEPRAPRGEGEAGRKSRRDAALTPRAERGGCVER